MNEQKNLKVKLKESEKYPISSDLYGIFLEDINFACDGGLNANAVNNYSFDGVYQDRKSHGKAEDSLRYWNVGAGQLLSASEGAMSKNSRYATVVSPGKAVISNKGYNGNKAYDGKAAISVTGGCNYVFSLYARKNSFCGSVFVSVITDDEIALTEKKEFEIKNTEWEKTELSLKGINSGYGRLQIEFVGNGKLDIDCVVFRSEDVWGKDDPKWRHGKMRRDLVEALAALKPKFMRFPGGCIVEGEYPGNEYNWKDTVGELWERKANYNLWSESLENGGYCQSYQIGFYEYFCLCEDLGMKPLPTLWAGLNCQYRARDRHEPCPEIAVCDPCFQTEVIDSYLDLIEFATGDPDKNEWAALRSKMGHPKPFFLDRIGIGNENYDEIYFEKFNVIKKAIHEKYPDIICVLSTGGSPDKDKINPVWEFANKDHRDCILDEHSYNDPEWFIREEKRFDNYDRNGAKAYMGEYAANGTPSPRKGTGDNGNYFESAIAEAAFLCGIERNADVCIMSSYAPLFNLIGSDQWRHNLIDFNPACLCETSNYLIQKLFGTTSGNTYIPTDCEKPERVFVSCVENGSEKHLRIVNITDEEYTLTAEAGSKIASAKCTAVYSPEGVMVKNRLNFYGIPDYKIKQEETAPSVSGNELSITVKPMSVNVISICE
ncbi:MAG: alpha-L-arabinofuranosidase C-terminal domain-containing protein [Acutalibacteraceae bacterium]